MDAVRVAHQYLPGLFLTFVRLCVWLALLAAVFVPLERLFALQPQKILRKGVLTDLGYYFLNGFVPSLFLSAPLALVAWGAHSLLPGAVSATIAHWPLWLRAVATMVVGETGFYWGHRWSHEIPFLWRFHSIHHSAEHIDWLVSTRGHPVDLVFTRLCGFVLIYTLGLADPLSASGNVLVLLFLVVGTAWGFFIHANVRWRLGPLEHLIATPAFHHWHHTLADHRDRNFAPMLPWVDRIFGTFYLPRRDWPAAYGIDTPIPSGLGEQLIEPLVPSRQ